MLEQLLRCPDVAAAIKNIDLIGLRKIASLYQMEQHSALLAVSMTDQESIGNIVAYCKGASGLVLWIESLKEALAECEAAEMGGGNDDGQVF